MTWNRPQILFSALLLAVVFSVQFPVPGVGSQFVSLNLSDLVALAIVIAFVVERSVADDWHISIPLPRITALYILATVWIVITVAVAVIREPVSVVASTFWTLKWLEILVVFVLAQQYRDEIDWRSIMSLLIGAALLISLAAIVETATTSGWNQPTVFWHNPNTLAVFLGLPSLLCLAFGAVEIQRRPRVGVLSLGLGLVLVLGVGATGSRSGVITLVVGATVAVILARRRISTPLLLGTASGGVLLGLGGLWLTDRFYLFRRFFPTITLQEGGIVFSGPGTNGLYTRYELVIDAIGLWSRQPVFGYGWMASPENPHVGYLDVLYSQLLVDVGLFGLVLVLALYLGIARAFIIRRADSSLALCVTGAGWLFGMLTAGIGGAHVRVPRLMFLLVIILAAAAHLSCRDR
ncbi:O-antigen ligase family protein [Halorhabdus sp. BNX81]|uniref:O-antigen ligase family protein n=1 Tax=Halorhabdus sp. BNX81 TaxID=2980181 RepID=UPI0023DD4EE2|nr:O-antigen ligase family protein [Halorhabdus sp. BNX81]WEL20554.1 hypothetical protein HBNXHr_0479 [Halorhabdus sp. BNX81]